MLSNEKARLALRTEDLVNSLYPHKCCTFKQKSIKISATYTYIYMHIYYVQLNLPHLALMTCSVSSASFLSSPGYSEGPAPRFSTKASVFFQYLLEPCSIFNNNEDALNPYGIYFSPYRNFYSYHSRKET